MLAVRRSRAGVIRARPLPIALLLAVVVAVASTSPSGVLMLAPALLLLGVVLAGRMPGERTLLRWRRRARRRRSRVPVLVPRGDRPPFVRACSRMSASALAMRPPPAGRPARA